VAAVAQVTVFGAGAMGTALAMHAARAGVPTALWANPLDERALAGMRAERRHPTLPEHLPDSLQVFGPEELETAAQGCEVAVLGASSAGARSLAAMVAHVTGPAGSVVSLAKGLEPDSLLRVSEVYAEVLGREEVIAVGGPCLAGELAEDQPSAAVWAADRLGAARAAGDRLVNDSYQVTYSDDLPGVEYAAVVKNVAAIGMGILDGLAGRREQDLRNAKAALFTLAVHELATLVTALGGRRETALGLAGLGDALVTSLGGRNRRYGEVVGTGADPKAALERMEAEGHTVEGVDSTRALRALADRAGVDLPYHLAVEGVLFGGNDPATLLEVLR
jgi:glycerol-3-phosphate dehydrogenase (NAD(P)+)